MISGTYYNIAETATQLGVHRITVRRWLQSGKIKGQRVGNMVLIDESEVERLQKIKASVTVN